MPRLLACLAALAVFALASTGSCKPPDLPQYQRVTVLPGAPELDPHLLTAFSFLSNYPIQFLEVGDPVLPAEGPRGEEDSEIRQPEPARRTPREEPTCRGCPIQKQPAPHGCGQLDASASRSILDDLKRLEEVAETVEKARELAREGKVREAAACLEQARKMAPGSPCEKTIDELMTEIATEEQQEQPEPKQAEGQPFAARRRAVHQLGMCWLGRVVRFTSKHQIKVEVTVGPAKQPAPLTCQEKVCRPLAARLRDVPLCGALDQVRHMVGCGVRIDFEGLHKVGASPVTLVSCEADGLPLHVVLDLMLRPHRLQARVIDGVIEVTCADECGPCWKPAEKEDPAACQESACPKCEDLHRKAVKARVAITAASARASASKAHRPAKVKYDGKAEMVYGLMKACRLAIADGRFEKAADLARQAHAVDPSAVEADPMVIKLDLLEQYKPAPKGGLLPTGGAGEEQEEPSADGTITLVPHFPGLDPMIVEALDAMLKARKEK